MGVLFRPQHISYTSLGRILGKFSYNSKTWIKGDFEEKTLNYQTRADQPAGTGRKKNAQIIFTGI